MGDDSLEHRLDIYKRYLNEIRRDPYLEAQSIREACERLQCELRAYRSWLDRNKKDEQKSK